MLLFRFFIPTLYLIIGVTSPHLRISNEKGNQVQVLNRPAAVTSFQ